MAALAIPILAYHSVDLRSEDYLTVARDQFARQIEHLAGRHAFVTAHDVAAGQVPDDALVVSFDDSLRDNLEHALPVLQQFGARAVFFVITGYLGRNNAWNHRAYRFADHMAPRDLWDLARAGNEIGSHSATHQRLTKLSDAQLEDELLSSRDMITALCGVAPVAFAYPYGGFDARCIAAVRRHYNFGFGSAREGDYDWSATPGSIRRIFVDAADEPEELDRKIKAYQPAGAHG
jgi:peptidoglycan/xylan/chitin deacetylase (PgdA/CDA1 family)